MEKDHYYEIEVKWTGNLGTGTKSYTSYKRDHEIIAAGKEKISGSSDPSFRGDEKRYNPEELLVSTLSSCHMLFYLHFCAVNKITIEEYVDQAEGIMHETPEGSGYFTKVTLKPSILIREPEKVKLAMDLHHDAHKSCFIANSVNFEVLVVPNIKTVE